MRARGPRELHAGQAAGVAPPNWLSSWLWVLSVSWASLVPPAAGNASRWAASLR
jgi:hypothetical protein